MYGPRNLAGARPAPHQPASAQEAPALAVAARALALAEHADNLGLSRAAFLLHEAAVEACLTQCDEDIPLPADPPRPSRLRANRTAMNS